MLSCTGGLVFDEKIQNCNYASFVDCNPVKSQGKAKDAVESTAPGPKSLTPGGTQHLEEMKTLSQFLKGTAPEKLFIVEKMPSSVHTLDKSEASRTTSTTAKVKEGAEVAGDQRTKSGMYRLFRVR